MSLKKICASKFSVENDRLVGVLSLKDIAVAADKRWAYPESATAEQKLGEIVEAIASARS